jgi:hypothetical protein
MGEQMNRKSKTQGHTRNSHMASLMVSTSKDQRRVAERPAGRDTVVGRGGSSSGVAAKRSKR